MTVKVKFGEERALALGCFSGFGPAVITHDFTPTEHLWDELQCWLWARPSPQTLIANFTNAFVTGHKFPKIYSKILPITFPKEWRLLIVQDTRQLNITVHEYDVQQVHKDVMVMCPHSFSHILYSCTNRANAIQWVCEWKSVEKSTVLL